MKLADKELKTDADGSHLLGGRDELDAVAQPNVLLRHDRNCSSEGADLAGQRDRLAELQPGDRTG